MHIYIYIYIYFLNTDKYRKLTDLIIYVHIVNLLQLTVQT